MEARARIPVDPPVASPTPSYWQDQKSPLANIYHGQDNPSQPYDHIIIGSGISGTMIAYNLLQAQPLTCIMMLEARELCSGATGRNGGHTKAASYRSYMRHSEELGKEEALKIARLEWENIVETHRLAEELGIDCENDLCKTVDVVYDKATFERGKVAIQRLRAEAAEEEKEEGGMAWYDIHEDVDSVCERFCVAAQNGNPAVEGEEVVVGAFEYMAGRIHAYRFTTGVLEKCVEKGLQICTNTPVQEIRPSKPDEDFKWEIRTPQSSFHTRNLILATNGYTPYLEHALQGAIVPMRGQITVQKPGVDTKLPTPLPTTFSFIYRAGYEYMIPRPLPDGGQHIIIGGGLGRLPEAGASEFGTVDDGSLNSEISEYLHGSLMGYFGTSNWGETGKEGASARVVQEWTGIMGATADGRPFVGNVPGHKSLWISAGFNGHGMVLCLKSAEALVKMIDYETKCRAGAKPPALDWFPKSFLINQERLEKCRFKGRTDLLPQE